MRSFRFAISAIALSAIVCACNSTDGQRLPPADLLPSPAPTASVPTPLSTPTSISTVAATSAPTSVPTPTPAPASTLAPQPVALAQSVTGDQVACLLTINNSVYGFVGSDGAPALSEVLIASGDAVVANRNRAGIASGNRRKAAQGSSSTIPMVYPVDGCAADPVNDDLYVFNKDFPLLTIVHVDPPTLAMSVLYSYSLDDEGSGAAISFARGYACTFGVAFDPIDGGILVAGASGYQLRSSARAGPNANALLKQFLFPPSEDFGYDPVTDQIWSPSDIDGTLGYRLIDVRSGASWALAPNFNGINPGQGSIDSSDDVALSVSDSGTGLALGALGSAHLAGNQLTFSNAQVTTLSQDIETALSGPLNLDMAVDPASHLAFMTSGRANSSIGAMQLPSTATSALVPADYVFAPAFAGNTSYSFALWPHVPSTFYLPSGAGPYGLALTSTMPGVPQSLLVVDLRKLLAAQRNPAFPSLTDSTDDLAGAGIVTVIPI